MIKILNLFLLLQTISGEIIPQTLILDTATDLEFPVTGEYEDDNKPIPVVDVSAVIGGDAELPCDISPPDPGDSVYLVLWYRDLAGKPLYSFDIRGRPSETANHWSADPPFGFGRRGTFRVGTKPAALIISNISMVDQGVYRCRVDYRNSPTRNMKLNLTIVEEPHAPQILEDELTDVRGAFAGPFNEGEELRLLCQVHGGRPAPSVFWYIGDDIVDESFNRVPGRDIVTNRLRYTRLGREMNNKKISCVAKNNEINEPKTRTVTIRMNLRPETVKILHKAEFLVEGKPVQIICEARGSEPPARIRWFIGDKPVQEVHVQNNPIGSITTSILTFTPGKGDNREGITCRGYNENMPGTALEDQWNISVMYKPRLSLSLGRTLDPSEIKEGDDVYLECSIISNPPVNRLEWYHEETQLFHNSTAGILLSNQSLVIQGIDESGKGGYTCRAENKQGNSTSNIVNIRIKYRPMCRHQTEPKIAMDSDNPTIIDCELDSNPDITDVIWIASKGGYQQRISSEHYTFSKGMSRLSFKTARENEYGSVLCYGINDIGTQKDPCVFSLEPAGRPHALQNCTMDNKTSVLHIICQPGFNGGLVQRFTLQILQSGTSIVLANLTRTEPTFKISEFYTTYKVAIQIFSHNKQGSSEPYLVAEGITLRRPGIHSPVVPEEDGGLERGFLAAGATLLSCILVLLIAALVYIKRKGSGKKLLVMDHCVGREKVDRIRSREVNSLSKDKEEEEEGEGGDEEECPEFPAFQQKSDRYEPGYASNRCGNIDISNLQLSSESKVEEAKPAAAPLNRVACKPILKNRIQNIINTKPEEVNPDQECITWYSNPLNTTFFPSEIPYSPTPTQDAYSTLQTRRQGQYSGSYHHSGAERSKGYRKTGTGESTSEYRNHAGNIGTIPRTGPQDPFNYRSGQHYM
ncbi:protein turtle [Eurytemora carolleeae]|uniref:protein turtle n=1 Tax=Eurytemora carolleeae TaxID=1294199 RepID=UPI000C757661|nr:protein turtle [Eurytemora carolleeae]|eukprot:XP_023326509.1 protein turtle-like [Eurytemora affinis]